MGAMNTISRKWRALNNQSGNVAMISALAVIPIVSIAGLAVDFQMTTTQKNRVQLFMDSAVIAGSKAMQEGKTQSEIIADIQAYVSASTSGESGLTCNNVNVVFPEDSQDIGATMRCSQSTTLSGVMGKEKMDFDVASGTTYGVGKIDVAFVFDVSGSMQGDSKMGVLKTAATEAIDALLPENAVLEGELRVAMTSYGNGVNAGEFYEQVTGETGPHDVSTEIWRWVDGYGWDYEESITSQRSDTCTYDRLGSERYTDDKANSADPLLINKGWRYADRANNLLTNGSLETTSFSGSWTTKSSMEGWSSTTNKFEVWTDGFNGVDAQADDYFIEIDSAHGTISQMVDTSERDYYDIILRFAPRPGQINHSKMKVYWGDDLIDTIVPTEYGWKTYHYHVKGKADADETKLGFKAVSTATMGGMLDDIWVSFQGDSCPGDEPVPLTDDREPLIDFIDGLEARGATSGHHGLAWGWYLVSPEWNDYYETDSDAWEYDEPDSSKVIILMTDGSFNRTLAWSENGSSDSQARKYCENIKDEGIVIFTIAFQAPEDAENLLAYCATDSSKAFKATNGETLTDAYKTIASTISDLRITH